MHRLLFRLLLATLLVPLAGLASRSALRDMDDLVRASNQAFEAGNLARAAQLLEQAQRLAPDPRLVAFNLATVRYYQARTGQPAALAEAELYYRCCLEPGDMRRAEAYLGLGNCLLLRGSSGKLDALALRAAIDRFTLCQREPGCSRQIAQAARWNQQRARLLLLQTPPPPDAADDSSSDDSTSDKPDDPPPTPVPGNREPGDSGTVEPNPKEKANPDAKAQETEAKGKPGPGRGTEATIPDQADAPPLGAADATVHLEGALRRISADWLSHRRGRSRPSRPGVRDW